MRYPVHLTFGEAIHVRINLAVRSPVRCISPAQRSVHRPLDNCYADQAVTNARQLMDLLSGPLPAWATGVGGLHFDPSGTHAIYGLLRNLTASTWTSHDGAPVKLADGYAAPAW